jgi:hypothetical protein
MTLERRNRGKSHTYYADGNKMPGVTSILDVQAKPALIEWAGNATADYALDNWEDLGGLPPSKRHERLKRGRYEARDKAKVRGTDVHKLAEELVAGREVDVPEHLAGHVDAYIAFLEQFAPDPRAIELVVCHRGVGYCGTADLVAFMLGEVWLLDIKTGSGIYAETALQATAYMRAETFTLEGENGRERQLSTLGIQRAGAVHLRADGYDLYPLECGEDVWAYFRRLAWLYQHCEIDRGKPKLPEWVGEAIYPPLRAVPEIQEVS